MSSVCECSGSFLTVECFEMGDLASRCAGGWLAIFLCNNPIIVFHCVDTCHCYDTLVFPNCHSTCFCVRSSVLFDISGPGLLLVPLLVVHFAKPKIKAVFDMYTNQFVSWQEMGRDDGGGPTMVVDKTKAQMKYTTETF